MEYHHPNLVLGRLFSEVATSLAVAVQSGGCSSLRSCCRWLAAASASEAVRPEASARRSVAAQAVGDNLHVSTVGELSAPAATTRAVSA
ncbi:hypothetical protein MUK42_27571 [Musa troglodytarum]|uniref:Uncharacterized protein n=1 Tax=Musa troglodytarum TaxID=320322 RepID=A0A9E7G9Y3_9LILI|nr:hypothetical protein MUK42_27571 [Musa troglodytarum]